MISNNYKKNNRLLKMASKQESKYETLSVSPEFAEGVRQEAKRDGKTIEGVLKGRTDKAKQYDDLKKKYDNLVENILTKVKNL